MHGPRAHVPAPTQRGHGRSDTPSPQMPGAYDWRALGDDLAAVLRTLGVSGALGVGHSSGGYAMAHVAVRERPISRASGVSVSQAVGYERPKHGREGWS
jgi:pimeloyl-ACP methyl ester carboxylesterase